jgi:hypothetical protein
MIEQPLEAWVAFFRDANLPVLRHTVQEMERMRPNAENVNGRQLSATILRDPMMTLRVLAYLEANRGARQTTDITTIERAIMMIGIVPFFRDFNELPQIEEQLRPHPQALLGILKVVNRARRAAQWARDWAIVRHDLDVDEITLAALLHDFAELLMWCFAPELAIKVRDTQVANRNQRSADIQAQLYGVPLYQLKMALAETWRLPQASDPVDGQRECRKSPGTQREAGRRSRQALGEQLDRRGPARRFQGNPRPAAHQPAIPGASPGRRRSHVDRPSGYGRAAPEEDEEASRSSEAP